MKKVLYIGLLVAVVFAAYLMGQQSTNEVVTEDRTLSQPNLPDGVTVVAQDLLVPWDIAFLPEGGQLVTERVSYPDAFFKPGRLLYFNADWSNRQEIAIPNTDPGLQIGLRGVVLHPNFKTNKQVYLYQTLNTVGNTARIVRYKFEDQELREPTIILDAIPGGPFQDGGRMLFGEDGLLYVTSGDGAQADRAQDIDSLAGKVLRMTADGAIPDSNPYNTLVYSSGHRNPQGITWDAAGRLWSSEHGAPGGLDEINLIELSGNYGWPDSQGSSVAPGTVAPVLQSGAETWAPGSIAFVDGYLLWGGLAPETLYVGQVSDTSVTMVERLYQNQFGRIRTVLVGPDEYIYFMTSNMDQRADIRPNDDKILRIHKNDLMESLE